MRLSTRPDEYLGQREQWDHAEAQLKGALEAVDALYTVNDGDGAFYGPKSTSTSLTLSGESGNARPFNWTTNSRQDLD